MASLRKIVRRINSVQNTKQITSAMKMVSAAKLQKAQKSILTTRLFSENLDLVMGQIASRRKLLSNKLMQSNKVGTKKLFVVITSDKGLCGGFNSNLNKHMLSVYNNRLEDDVIEIVAIGKKARDFFKSRNVTILKEFIGIFDRLSKNHAEQIIDYLVDLYESDEYKEINIVYNKFKSMLVQEITVEKLFPFESADIDESRNKSDFTYDIEENEIIATILKETLKLKVWKILLESFSSEQAARRNAMESATDNAVDMIKKLTIYKNRVRQAVITTEITEIVSGAEALKS